MICFPKWGLKCHSNFQPPLWLLAMLTFLLKYTNMMIFGEKSLATTIFCKSSRHAWLQTSRRWNVSWPTRIDFESRKASRLLLPFVSTFSWGEDGENYVWEYFNLLLFFTGYFALISDLSRCSSLYLVFTFFSGWKENLFQHHGCSKEIGKWAASSHV